MGLGIDNAIRRDILMRAAQLANSANLPPEAKLAGAIFREADHMSSFEHFSLSYDTDIFTGMDLDRAKVIDIELRVIAQEAIRLAILEKPEEFVGLILAGIRSGNPSLSQTL